MSRHRMMIMMRIRFLARGKAVGSDYKAFYRKNVTPMTLEDTESEASTSGSFFKLLIIKTTKH